MNLNRKRLRDNTKPEEEKREAALACVKDKLFQKHEDFRQIKGNFEDKGKVQRRGELLRVRKVEGDFLDEGNLRGECSGALLED